MKVRALFWGGLLPATLLLSAPAAGDDLCKLGSSRLSALEHLCDARDGMVRLQIAGLWGFARVDGGLAIAPQYEEAEDFVQGRAKAKKDGLWGVIDRDGRWLIEPRFKELGEGSEGLTQASLDQVNQGWIDAQGQWVLGPGAEGHSGPFHNGVAVLSREGEPSRLIDRQGRVLKQFEPDLRVEERPNVHGLYRVTQSGTPELRHLDGRRVPLPAGVRLLGWYREGRFGAELDTQQAGESVRLQGALNEAGDWAIPARYAELRAFRDGLAPARLVAGATGGQGAWGLVDVQGHMVVPALYRQITELPAGGWQAELPDSESGGAGARELLGRQGERLVRFDCGSVDERTSQAHQVQGWQVFSGCGQTWAMREGSQAWRSRVLEPRVEATAEILVLQPGFDRYGAAEEPPQVELFDRRGRLLVTEQELGIRTPRFNLILLRPPEGAEAEWPIALVSPDFERLRLLRRDLSLADAPEWRYESELGDYDRKSLSLPLAIPTEQGWGAIDAQGRWVIPPGFAQLGPFEHGMAFVRDDEGLAVVDAKGQLHRLPAGAWQVQRVAPGLLEWEGEDGERVRMDLATQQHKRLPAPPEGPFYAGLAAQVNAARSLWGLRNEQGEAVLPEQYRQLEAQQVGPYERQRFVGWRTRRTVNGGRGEESLYGWVDAQGQERVPARYTELRYLEQLGALQVQHGYGAAGLLTLNGEDVLPARYQDITELGGAWFSAHAMEQTGLVDARGEWVRTLTPGLRIPDEGVAIDQVAGELRLVDARGRIGSRSQPLEPERDDPGHWFQLSDEDESDAGQSVYYGSDLRVRVRVPGRAPEHTRFSEGVLPFTPKQVTPQRRLGLLDPQGKVLGMYALDGMEPAREGHLLAWLEGYDPTGAEATAGPPPRYGFLDVRGRMVLAPRWVAARGVSEQRAVVVERGNLSLIDLRGQVLLTGAWQCGRQPVLLDAKRQVVWPDSARQRQAC